MRFLEWLATSPLATFVKVFIAVLLTAAVADWANVGDITLADWKLWVIAALVSAIPVLVNWLNPVFPMYGRGKVVAAVEVVEQ